MLNPVTAINRGWMNEPPMMRAASYAKVQR